MTTKTTKFRLSMLKGDPFLLWAAEDLIARGQTESQAVEVVINTYIKNRK